jgi:hypothetical protein
VTTTLQTAIVPDWLYRVPHSRMALVTVFDSLANVPPGFTLPLYRRKRQKNEQSPVPTDYIIVAEIGVGVVSAIDAIFAIGSRVPIRSPAPMIDAATAATVLPVVGAVEGAASWIAQRFGGQRIGGGPV